MRKAGVDFATLSQWLGLAGLNTTMREPTSTSSDRHSPKCSPMRSRLLVEDGC
jgi:hypothetical protein